MYEGLEPSCCDGDELEHRGPEAAEAAVRALKDAAYGGAAHILAPRVTEEAAQIGECIPREGASTPCGHSSPRPPPLRQLHGPMPLRRNRMNTKDSCLSLRRPD